MDPIIYISDTSLDGNNSPNTSNIVVRYNKGESNIKHGSAFTKKKVIENIIECDDEPSVSAITLSSSFPNRVPVSWKNVKCGKKLLNVKMSTQTPNTKVNSWLNKAPFTETHLNSMKVLTDVQVAAKPHFRKLEQLNCERPDNNSSTTNSSVEMDLINTYLNSSSPKSVGGSKCSVDSIELAKARIFISNQSPFSPGSQENTQEKNELYSYLKLTNMKHSETKNGNIYTNRRSTRVKNSIRLAEQRKLEEKLNNEKSIKDPSLDLSKMSFRDLNISIDDLCNDDYDGPSKSEKSIASNKNKCNIISMHTIPAPEFEQSTTNSYDRPGKSIFNGNFNAKHVPSDILLEETDFEEALHDFVKDKGEKIQIGMKLFHEDLNVRLLNINEPTCSKLKLRSAVELDPNFSKSRLRRKSVTELDVSSNGLDQYKIVQKSDDSSQKASPEKKISFPNLKKSKGVKRKGQEITQQSKFRKLKTRLKSIRILPNRFKKKRDEKLARELKSIKNIPKEFLKSKVLSTSSDIRKTRANLASNAHKTKKKYISKYKQRKAIGKLGLISNQTVQNITDSSSNHIPDASNTPSKILTRNSKSNDSITPIINTKNTLSDEQINETVKMKAKARSRAMLLRSIFSANKKRPKIRKKRLNTTKSEDLVSKIISLENDNSSTYISAGSKVLTEDVDLGNHQPISIHEFEKYCDNVSLKPEAGGSKQSPCKISTVNDVSSCSNKLVESSKFVIKFRESEVVTPKKNTKNLLNGHQNDFKVVTTTKTVIATKQIPSKGTEDFLKNNITDLSTEDKPIQLKISDNIAISIRKRSLRNSKTLEIPTLMETTKSNKPILNSNKNLLINAKPNELSVKNDEAIPRVTRKDCSVGPIPRVTRKDCSIGPIPRVTRKECSVNNTEIIFIPQIDTSQCSKATIVLLQNDITPTDSGASNKNLSVFQNEHNYTLNPLNTTEIEIKDIECDTLKNLTPEHRKSLLKSPAVLQNQIKFRTPSVNDKYEIDDDTSNYLCPNIANPMPNTKNVFCKINKDNTKRNCDRIQSVVVPHVSPRQTAIRDKELATESCAKGISEHDFDTYASKFQGNVLFDIQNYGSSIGSTPEYEDIIEENLSSTDTTKTILRSFTRKSVENIEGKSKQITSKLSRKALEVCIDRVKESLPSIDVAGISKLQNKLTKATMDLVGVQTLAKDELGTDKSVKINVRTDLTDPNLFNSNKNTPIDNKGEKVIDLDAILTKKQERSIRVKTPTALTRIKIEKKLVVDNALTKKDKKISAKIIDGHAPITRQSETNCQPTKKGNDINPESALTKKQNENIPSRKENERILNTESILTKKQNENLIHVEDAPTKKHCEITINVGTVSPKKQNENITKLEALPKPNDKLETSSLNKQNDSVDVILSKKRVDSSSAKKTVNLEPSQTIKQKEKLIPSPTKKLNGNLSQYKANSIEPRSLHNILTTSVRKPVNNDNSLECAATWEEETLPSKSVDSQPTVKARSHPVEISEDNGPVLYSYYLDYNLVVAQELRISFWNQSPLGNVLGAQDMWIPKGFIPRLSLDQGCVHRKSKESVIFKDNSFAYVELWTKEHKSDYRQSPVADVFAVVYFWKNKVGVEKKVLQLENIHSYAEDVRFVVLKNSLKILVSWRVTNDSTTKSIIRCYQLASDYKSVLDSKEMESVAHEITSLHNVADNDGVVVAGGEHKLTIWNLEYGYIEATIDIAADNLPSPMTMWVKCDRGFLFTLQNYEDGILRLIAVNGLCQSSKRLQVFKPPSGYEGLQGVCIGNGVLITFYSNGIICWNMQNGDLVLEEQTQDTKYMPSDEHVITFTQDRVNVKYGLSYLISNYDFSDI